MKPFITLLTILISTYVANAQPGAIDSSFGTNGIVRTFVNSSNAKLTAMAIQTDDKILVAGHDRYDTTNFNKAFVVMRYTADGLLDSSFASNGKMVYNFGNGNAIAYAIKVQADGKILVAGRSSAPGIVGMASIRLNMDGSLDTTYGSNGAVITAVGTANDFALGIYLHSDGRIVLGGASYLSSFSRMALVRYHSDGSIDTTFASNGTLIASVTGENIYCHRIEIDSSSNYIVSGNLSNITSTSAFLKRYTSNGILDVSFGLLGTWYPSVGNSFTESTTGLIKQADGKLIVGLTTDANSSRKFGVVRYLPSSWLVDSTFGIYTGNSYITTGINKYVATAIAQQPNGKIVISGNYQIGSEYKFTTLRYLANGILDSAFGTNGFVVTSITPTNNNSTSAEIGVQSSGKIIVAGNNTENNIQRFTLVRYHDTLSINTLIPRVKENQISLTVFPNPASDLLQVMCYAKNNTPFEEPMIPKVYTIQGVELNGIKFNKSILKNKVLSFELSIKDLVQGLYFIKIGSATARFIKE
ncbi:MAG TPA: hypothetical protein PLI68_04040 [Bacteroidia bacterium]|nr:hypothetical protein [Bacteroidia bacterium]HRH08736.1 hypothetical protein [Bacteroidia bacterium]HRH62477.1 hypothetical protein [Bacteroidia bacterium]